MLQKMYYWSIEDMKGVIRNRRIQNIMDKNTENKQLSTKHDTANYDCCVMLCRSFFSRFVLDQDVQLDLYSTSSLKQQSADIHVAPLGHYPVFAHSPQCCVLSGEATHTNCIVLGSNPRSTVFETSTFTITPTMSIPFF